MIWLSPTNGTEECSIYFDIRDIDLQCHGDETSAVVRGLLGDGACECWGEVVLGIVESARILPVWTESGEIESFPDVIDESLLEQQLLLEVKSLLHKITSIRGHIPSLNPVRSDVTGYCPASVAAA